MATASGNTDVTVTPPGEPAGETTSIASTTTATTSTKKLRQELRKKSRTRLLAMLEDEPFRVRFFQAVRLLQKMEHKSPRTAGKERGAVGFFNPPEAETIRFASLASLTFPPSELYDLEPNADGPAKMTVQFMGLNSAIAIMPVPYTELLMSRIKVKDHAMDEFLNMFNHRMISFFFRGWEKYRFFIEYEKSGQDRLSDRLLDLLGLGTRAMRERSGIPDLAYLNYVGLLGRHVRSSASLQQILEDYFRVTVRIEQFAGAWRRLKPENQTCFSDIGKASERLGVGVVAGDEVWDHHGRIRVSIGPMRLTQYLRFLPGQDAYHQLVAWVRFYSNGGYETEVRLVLVGEDAPQCELDGQGDGRPQLGLVSWLKTKPIERDPGDATYLIQ